MNIALIKLFLLKIERKKYAFGLKTTKIDKYFFSIVCFTPKKTLTMISGYSITHLKQKCNDNTKIFLTLITFKKISNKILVNNFFLYFWKSKYISRLPFSTTNFRICHFYTWFIWPNYTTQKRLHKAAKTSFY